MSTYHNLCSPGPGDVVYGDLRYCHQDEQTRLHPASVMSDWAVVKCEQLILRPTDFAILKHKPFVSPAGGIFEKGDDASSSESSR